ncbi:hypothetical protein [Pseudochryseolinea flava]|uniref:SnoaL-like domain-containing protein n=1 Tax=Pseudochryseolinea flava TaxID=2059302 RepID=A0A364XZW4_9BACT|nr:hypothetical protein [Pseudochryseolinea flava]RAV99028.1 hypothetical protein DQQ10_20755 [Pseudochryseolinea flava]
MKEIVIKISLSMLLLIGVTTAFNTRKDRDFGTHQLDVETKKAVLKVLDEYMITFNAKNLKAWEATYHFPHFRLASGRMSVLENAGERDSTKVFVELSKAGWHRSAWDHRNIVQGDSSKVHIDTKFSRYRADGSKIASYESLYIVTKEKGRWGVKMRSSYAE